MGNNSNKKEKWITSKDIDVDEQGTYQQCKKKKKKMEDHVTDNEEKITAPFCSS